MMQCSNAGIFFSASFLLRAVLIRKADRPYRVSESMDTGCLVYKHNSNLI